MSRAKQEAMDGRDRVRAEMADRDGRVRAVLDAARPPSECGPEIPVAPGRGPMQSFVHREMVLTDAGNYTLRRAGYAGRCTARVADGFDVMTEQARRSHARKGKDAPPFIPPFTNGQVAIGRDYAALTERCASAGVKCSSMESFSGGGSQGGDREAAIFRDLQRLRAFHARIGQGLAKEIRRTRPSANGGDQRQAIHTRRLVDMVCLGGYTLKKILTIHHWQPNANVIKGLRADLCRALDRMQGYDLDRPQNMG